MQALKEIKMFMLPVGQPDKNRQKLMRNLRVRMHLICCSSPLLSLSIFSFDMMDFWIPSSGDRPSGEPAAVSSWRGG